LPPITFEISPHGPTGFKSISHLVWRDVPDLAILTGRNGSGKSQLFLYLAYALNQAADAQYPEVNSLRLEVKGASFEPGDVSYVPSSGEIIHNAGISVGQLPDIKRQTYQELQQSRGRPDIQSRRRHRWAAQVFGNDYSTLSLEDFIKKAPDDLSFMLEDSNPLHGLAHVFFGYRLQILSELEGGTTKEDAEKKLGPSPWKVLNDILAVAEFPYQVDIPSASLLQPYELRLIEKGNPIRPSDLSSGEKVILQLALWLYNSRHHNRFPKLLLLDEPDAHLHPSMTRQFMTVIQEVLVKEYGVRVMLTTHSPSTVALAPADSVFEMIRGATEIRPSQSRASSIGLLTAGLVVVSPTTRFVLVEDEADVAFYTAIRDVLSDYGPSRDKMALAPAPSMIFISVSVGKGRNKISGGRDNVINWIRKLDAAPFDQLVRGLIDRDAGNIATPRILVLSRYSIENYLLDPFVVFGLLVEANSNPPAGPVKITSGDEHLIRELADAELQSIVDYVQEKVEPKLTNLEAQDQATTLVEFTNGRQVSYPSWMLNRKGHDLLPAFQAAFGGPNQVSPDKLLKVLQRVRLIPKDLATLFSSLQAG
jgi:energy-coupling factor transporter ATP-binding protein EcfA2